MLLILLCYWDSVPTTVPTRRFLSRFLEAKLAALPPHAIRLGRLDTCTRVTLRHRNAIVLQNTPTHMRMEF